MTAARFGLLGHGVVGSLFARLLRSNGASVMSYDVVLEDPARRGEAEARIMADGSQAGSFEDVVRRSEVILAITPVQACRPVAVRASTCLLPGQIYCDLASAPPSLKRELAEAVGASGATFVEGAILGAVSAALTCPAILLGGPAAGDLSAKLNQYGLRTSVYAAEIGAASAFKMIRSVFSKGMETLLLETLVSAERAGLREEIWREILATLAPERMPKMLETWMRSHAISSERRYHEMVEVTGFLKELGITPLMTEASVEVFRRSNERGIAASFAGEPADFREVIAFLANGG